MQNYNHCYQESKMIVYIQTPQSCYICMDISVYYMYMYCTYAVFPIASQCIVIITATVIATISVMALLRTSINIIKAFVNILNLRKKHINNDCEVPSVVHDIYRYKLEEFQYIHCNMMSHSSVFQLFDECLETL